MQNCHRGKYEELKKGKEKKRRNCIENGVKGPERVGLVDHDWHQEILDQYDQNGIKR